MDITIADDQATTMQASIETILSVAQNGPQLCPIRHVLTRVGDKWSLLVIFNLGRMNTLRFNELRRRIAGISQRMLTVTLRSLEMDGLVVRRVYAEVPPRVEYHLTELGQSLLGVVIDLEKWATEHIPEINRARRAYTQQATAAFKQPDQ